MLLSYGDCHYAIFKQNREMLKIIQINIPIWHRYGHPDQTSQTIFFLSHEQSSFHAIFRHDTAQQHFQIRPS